MKNITLRGQLLNINDNTIFFNILKPLKNTFSINDKIYEFLTKGYIAQVTILTQKVILTKDTPFIKKEEVKSKFIGASPWSRYWYKIKDLGQQELF